MGELMIGHSIRVTVEDGACHTNAQFICHEPDGADCHCGCERPECEEGCSCRVNDREPQRKDWGECLFCVWLDESGTWTEQYEGPETEVRCGPIEITWNGDYYTWRYPDNVPPV